MSMAGDDVTIEILKDIRDDVRGVRSEVHDLRTDVQDLRSDTNKRSALVEAARVSALESRVDDLVSK
jgi:hypothetical protein